MIEKGFDLIENAIELLQSKKFDYEVESAIRVLVRSFRLADESNTRFREMLKVKEAIMQRDHKAIAALIVELAEERTR